MITLITGAPGIGKTACTVSMIMDGLFGDRPLFVDGIPGLKLPHFPSPEPADKWHQWLPEGSMLVIDEAQRVFRPRANGSKVPPHVEALETHRHQGCDLILVTQHPGLIDINVKNLVGRHIHIRKTILGLRLYEWSEVGQPGSKASRKDAIDRRYRLNRKVFGMYRSAVEHHKPLHRSSLAPYIAVLLAVAVVFAMLKLYRAFIAEKAPAEVTAVSSGSDSMPSPGKVDASQVTSVTVEKGVAPGGVVPGQYIPRWPGRPETAPAYDGLRQVNQVEMVVAGICSKSGCTCYNQQAVKVEMPDQDCQVFVKQGRFNPFAESASPAGKPSAAAVAAPEPSAGTAPKIVSAGSYEGNPIVSRDQPKFHTPFGGTDSKS